MIKKNITLITGTVQTKIALYNQLKEYLDDIAIIQCYAIDEGITKKIYDDLVVLSSEIVQKELISLNLLDTNCEVLIAKRTINYDYIDKIVMIPPGTKVLFVNDVKESTFESIDMLKSLGLDHISYIPHYPGIVSDVKDIDTAITPGEVDKVPSFIKNTYDIGPRIVDFTTITKILNKLNSLDEKGGQFTQKYLHKIINIARKIVNLNNQISNLNKNLKFIIDGLNDGLLVYTTKGEISVFNENLKKMLKTTYNDAVGKKLKEVIYKKNLLEFLLKSDLPEEKIFDIDDKEIVVKKFQPLSSDFIIVIFKNTKENLNISDVMRKKLINSGLFAKYTFEDIVGESENLKKTKQISKKLSQTDLAILIEGESGTGKELFASAIHNESKRKNAPFLAVNFSALPDELIESELFGYEEGSFTGAKKGGRSGFFEEANGGTIFLDEIGDISPKVQARLLRVLQEKEVMRIGGTQIKPVDVRVIAATNKDLGAMVREKMFREDLYYRLKIGYIKLPTLRERKEDIVNLIHHFINIESSEDVKIDNKVMDALLLYDWYGNVRELKNTLNYMLAVRENNYLTLNDIPNKCFFQLDTYTDIEFNIQDNMDLNEEDIFILKKIYEFNKEGKTVGRDLLAEETKGEKYELTKYQVRTRLNKLEKMELILKKKGKHGTILTQKGIRIIS